MRIIGPTPTWTCWSRQSRTDTATQRGIGAGGGAELDARLGADGSCRRRRPGAIGRAAALPYGGDPARAAAAARYVNVVRRWSRHIPTGSALSRRPRCRASTPRSTNRPGHRRTGHGRSPDEQHMLDRALTEADFEPVFAELDSRGAVLYLHPVGNGACSPLVSQHHLTWMVGAPFEDTIAAMQLITSGHPPAYPSVGSSVRTWARRYRCSPVALTITSSGSSRTLPKYPASRCGACGTTP